VQVKGRGALPQGRRHSRTHGPRSEFRWTCRNPACQAKARQILPGGNAPSIVLEDVTLAGRGEEAARGISKDVWVSSDDGNSRHGGDDHPRGTGEKKREAVDRGARAARWITENHYTDMCLLLCGGYAARTRGRRLWGIRPMLLFCGPSIGLTSACPPDWTAKVSASCARR
jgi:hypothetical protein